MIDEQKMINKGGEQIFKMGLEIIQAVILFVFISAAAATAPYFRKNMGERYFTYWKAVFGSVGWSVFLFIPIKPYLDMTVWPPWKMIIISFLIWYSYVKLMYIRLQEIRRRQAAGEVWHSRSKGESVFGSENFWRDLGIGIAVCIALWFYSKPCALFFALSRFLDFWADAIGFAQLYNRYLDVQDGKIEAEVMETVLREGFPPRRTFGLYQPLPKRFTGQHRANVARVVAAGNFGATPKNEKSATSFEQTPPPKPTATLETAKKALRSIGAVVLSKRFLLIVAIVVIGFCVIKFGSFTFHSLDTKVRHFLASRPKTAAVEPATAPATFVSAKPNAPAKPVPTLVFPPPVSIPPVAAAPSPEITAPPVQAATKPITQSPTQAKVAPDVGPPAQTEIAVAPQAKTFQGLTPAILATTRPPELKTNEQNTKPGDPPKSARAAANDAVITFSNYCVTTLAADNDRIGKIANNGFRDKLSAVSQKLQSWTSDMVSHQQDYLGNLTPGSEGDASVQRSIEKLNIDRDSVTNALMRFDTDIYNASLRR